MWKVVLRKLDLQFQIVVWNLKNHHLHLEVKSHIHLCESATPCLAWLLETQQAPLLSILSSALWIHPATTSLTYKSNIEIINRRVYMVEVATRMRTKSKVNKKKVTKECTESQKYIPGACMYSSKIDTACTLHIFIDVKLVWKICAPKDNWLLCRLGF